MKTIEHVNEIPRRTARRFLVERIGAGVPCRVTLQGTTVQLQTDDAPAPAVLVDAVQHDVRAALPDKTTLAGELVAFAGTVRQPVERVRHVLTHEPDAIDTLRWQVWARELVQREGEPVGPSTPRAARQALLDTLQPNAGVETTLAEERDGKQLDGLGRRHRVQYAIQPVDHCGERYIYAPRPTSSPPATARAEAYALGAASLETLVHEHGQLHEQLDDAVARQAELARTLQHQQQHNSERAALQQLGEETRQRLTHETMTHLRALLICELDDTLAEQLRAVEQQALSVTALKQLHADVEQRFRQQFPTRPLAQARGLQADDASRTTLDVEAFQCPRG